MEITLESKLVVEENGWWEGITVDDECSVLEIKDHSVLITNGTVRLEIPKTMLGDFSITNPF